MLLATMESCHVTHSTKCPAIVVVLAMPAASFANGGEAGTGNIADQRNSAGPANAGGMNNVTVDPSGISNASRIAPLPRPRITVPVIPHFK
jgi:hypothetical protein